MLSASFIPCENSIVNIDPLRWTNWKDRLTMLGDLGWAIKTLEHIVKSRDSVVRVFVVVVKKENMQLGFGKASL